MLQLQLKYRRESMESITIADNYVFLQREKRLSFEDPRATPSDPEGSRYCAQEWLEALERAKEYAMPLGLNKSYSDGSAISSPASTFEAENGLDGVNAPPTRHTLRKEHGDSDSLRGVKRFSKRHSKNGLAAVF